MIVFLENSIWRQRHDENEEENEAPERIFAKNKTYHHKGRQGWNKQWCL